MSDRRIIEYLRSRGEATPPLDLTSSILDASDGVAQQRHNWFAPLIPGVVAAAVASAVLAGALLIGQGPDVGPAPEPTAEPQPTAEPSVEPSAERTATPAPTPSDTDLLDVGSVVTVPVRSVDGVAGTITIERGEDIGGYPLVPEPSSETHFFVELLATYELDAAPETAQWGEIDWRVEGEGGTIGAELLRTFPQALDGRRGLGTWPGATVPEEEYVGWMIFAIPRQESGTALELVYQPDGVEDETRIPLRSPGEAPEPVAAEWPRPEPVYVSQAGSAITVLESAEADALFADADTCTNPEGRYTVSFPESWYTNTAIGDVPACSWFSPTFYEATPGGETPEEIAIAITVFEGAIGVIWADLYSEEVTLDGVPARRSETGFTKGSETPTDRFQYSYLARLDDDPSEGEKLWAFTGTDYGGEYELNKAVFDRIMASLEWER